MVVAQENCYQVFLGMDGVGKKWTKKSNTKILENCSKILIIVYMLNHFTDRREYLHDSSLREQESLLCGVFEASNGKSETSAQTRKSE